MRVSTLRALMSSPPMRSLLSITAGGSGGSAEFGTRRGFLIVDGAATSAPPAGAVSASPKATNRLKRSLSTLRLLRSTVIWIRLPVLAFQPLGRHRRDIEIGHRTKSAVDRFATFAAGVAAQ